MKKLDVDERWPELFAQLDQAQRAARSKPLRPPGMKAGSRTGRTSRT